MASESKNILDKGFKEINPVLCGREICDSGHSFGPAIRKYFLLHFVLSGKGIFRTKRGVAHLSAGDIFIIKPNEVTYYEADRSDPWEYYWIGFESSIALPEGLKGDYIYAPELRDVFLSAYDKDEKFASGRGYEEHLLASVYRIVSILLARDEKASSPDGYIHTAVSMIEKEYSNGITASDIAKRLHLSRTYFQQIFKEKTGQTPGAYLKELRMKRAEEMIKEGGYSFSVVAASVGYSDVFVFSRAFKNCFSLSASEYALRFSRVEGEEQ